MRRTLLLASLAGALGCANPNPYVCTSQAQCVSSGAQGVCVGGFCAFGDGQCDSGYRFESNAGGGLGGTCLAPDAGTPDASTCGQFGAACCDTGTACHAGASCVNDTCTSCVDDVAFGRRFGCVLHADHSVWCSGANTMGQLGFGLAGLPSATAMQVRVTGGSPLNAASLAIGRDHACAVTTTGTVMCWGANSLGQIGNGVAIPTMGSLPPQPAAVQVQKAGNVALDNIVEVALGMVFSCARDATGGVWCWGKNSEGQLGDGTTTSRAAAAPVLDAAAGPAWTGATKLFAAGERACARKANDEVWCWGRNSNGELADGTTIARSSPVRALVSGNVALGNFYTCQINADTTISCFGWNGHGRMALGSGDGYSDNMSYTTPQAVVTSKGGPPFMGALELAAGGVTCARTTTKGLVCWGDSQYGQNGQQNTTVPAPVLDAQGMPLTDIVHVIAGYPHACARRTTGEYLCWGRNSEGDLGDGTFMNRALAQPLAASCP